MQKEETHWAIAKIEEGAEVNLRLVKNGISEDLLVSFVPMPAVGAGDGSIDVSTVRPFSEVISCNVQNMHIDNLIRNCQQISGFSGSLFRIPEASNAI